MPRESKPPKWFAEFATNLNQRLDKIDERLERIENTPTMKRELSGE